MNYLLRIMLCSFSLMSIHAAETKKIATDPIRRDTLPSNNCTTCCSTTCFDCGTTIFIPRSQGANTARELVGWQKLIYIPYLAENYYTFATSMEYTRSFESCKLAKRLFCSNCLTFTGSQFIDRVNGQELVADNFGLPTNFNGSLAIKPFIENYIIDLNLFFGLSEWVQGLYLRVHAPITHTRWSLGLDDCLPCANKFRGSDTFPSCYMFSNTAPTIPSFEFGDDKTTCQVENAVNPLQLLNQSPLQFTNNNCTTQSLREALSGDFTFGDMQEKWKFGRFDFCPREKTGLADLDIILGLNFFQTDYGHFGFYAQLVVPTGNKPKSKYIFEPLVGNGRHLELGGGFTMHLSLYNDHCKESRNLSFYLEGNVTHLFKNDQKRSFDFKHNGLLSRYLLLKEYDINNNYIGRMINAINFATRNADVTINYKVDVSAKLALFIGGWTTDLGYNIYAQDREKVCIKTECPCDIDQRRFGFKGTEGVCCSNATISNGEVTPSNSSFLVNGAQPNATMFIANSPKSAPLKPGATEACLAYNSKALNNTIPLSQLTPANGYVLASNEPVRIINCSDLDPNSAAQCRMITHKFFGHIGYTWFKVCYTPFIGLGGEIETNLQKSNSGLNQWGIWIKGGLSF